VEYYSTKIHNTQPKRKKNYLNLFLKRIENSSENGMIMSLGRLITVFGIFIINDNVGQPI